VDLQIADAETE